MSCFKHYMYMIFREQLILNYKLTLVLFIHTLYFAHAICNAYPKVICKLYYYIGKQIVLSSLGQNCSHVATVLFKVDFCWRYGYVQRDVTSKPCVCTHGGKSVLVAPQMVQDITILKPKAGRPGDVFYFGLAC